jgi:hypothetical protein
MLTFAVPVVCAGSVVKVLGYILAGCIMVAVAQAIITALVVVIFLAIVIGALTRPRETFGLIALAIIADFVRACPSASLAALAIIIIVAAISNTFRQPQRPSDRQSKP